MAAILASAEFGDGDGGGGCCDLRDITIHILEQQLAEFRAVTRRLLDTDGEEAGEAIEAAEKLCNAYDQIDREDQAEADLTAFVEAPHCVCGALKGSGTAYCPVCDADTLARRTAAPDNVVSLHCPF